MADDPTPVETPTPEGQGDEGSELPLAGAHRQVWVDLEADAEDEAEAGAEETVEETPGEPSGAADEGQEEATEEGAEAAEEQVAAGAPDDEAEPAPSGVASEEPEAEAEGDTQPPVDAAPFTFAVDGTKVEVPGAVVGTAPNAEGEEQEFILIPKDAWQRTVQPRLADRVAIQQRETALRRELDNARRELAPERHEDVVRARAFSEEFEKVLSSEESLRDFLENFERGKAALKDRVERRVLESRVEARDEDDQARERESRVEEWAQTMVQDLPAVVDNLLSDERVKPLVPNGDFEERFRRHIYENSGRFYEVGTEETEAAGGLKEGQLGRRDDLIVSELQRALDFATVSGGNSAGGNNGSTAADKAAKKNAAALGGGPKPPTTPSPKATPPPASSANEVPTFKTKKELMDWAYR